MVSPQLRDDAGHFLKGVSGNPGGKSPATLDFKALCRTYADTKGWKNLTKVAGDLNHRDSIRALELIFAYAYGKPTQRIEGGSELVQALQGLAKLALLRAINGQDPIEAEFRMLREGKTAL